MSNPDSQLEHVHQLCTSHLQIASSVSLRKRTRPAPSRAVLMSSEPKKEVEMTELSLSTSEEAKLLKPVIESLGKSLTSSGDAEPKPAMEPQPAVKDLNRKRPIRMARIVDYVFCVCVFAALCDAQGDIDEVYTRLLSVIDINFLFHRQNCIVCVSLFCEAPDDCFDSNSA